MKFKIEGITNIGNYRKSNQDFIGFLDKKNGSSISVVCDGMGGHAHGEIASKMAVELLLKNFHEVDLSNFTDSEINVWLRNSIKQILKEMKEYSNINIETKDMGTTLTAILFVNKKAFVVNVGDSRTYKISKNKISQVTKDQNLWNDTKNKEEKKKEIKKFLGAKFNELTYWKVLTSALGPNKNLKIDTYLIKEPIGTYVLTTDGVHDYIDEVTLKEMVLEKSRLKTKAKEIVSYALKNLSTDNLSLLIVEASGD
ncbi:phosphorylated protein phosphatase [Entomoplasma ellychniae]|uniref:Phosphorylated protein phosphatase n=2 Tax=Entomoplasmataceae TaxID=33925 RepID=A0A2S5RGM0_9MOLU|nr:MULTISPECIES: protein phosphatase 2C domain-containing protein [Entomoplasmataceae]PPE05014.1 phosphorylated protein phosphatase [Entomoplasma ellychniae]PPE06453.1 phosphorylated protein phosphatase [Mesoplasma corruscae]